MRITIGGKAGSGKTTVAKLLAKRLNLKYYSIGKIQRAIAKKRGITILELSRVEEQNPEIDKEIDEKQKELAKEDNFVLDSRLGAFFIKNSIKVFLDANEFVRAKRILKDKRVAENNKNLKEVIKNMRQREESEKRRYKSYYNINCYNKNYYDIVIDTTNLTPEEVVTKIIKKLNL